MYCKYKQTICLEVDFFANFAKSVLLIKLIFTKTHS